MLKKMILLGIVLIALLGAGTALVYKREASLTLRIKQYHSAVSAQDFETAYNLANQLAADGYLPAHGFLAMLYENGTGVIQNMDIAVAQYKLAAMSGDAAAQTHLAGLYLSGKGVEESQTMAVHWYEKAAAQNHPEAQYELGRLYQNGTLKTEDTNKARTLLMGASQGGYARANTILANMDASELGLR